MGAEQGARKEGYKNDGNANFVVIVLISSVRFGIRSG
jgi:hypothetical protein